MSVNDMLVLLLLANTMYTDNNKFSLAAHTAVISV